MTGGEPYSEIFHILLNAWQLKNHTNSEQCEGRKTQINQHRRQTNTTHEMHARAHSNTYICSTHILCFEQCMTGCGVVFFFVAVLFCHIFHSWFHMPAATRIFALWTHNLHFCQQRLHYRGHSWLCLYKVDFLTSCDLSYFLNEKLKRLWKVYFNKKSTENLIHSKICVPKSICHSSSM